MNRTTVLLSSVAVLLSSCGRPSAEDVLAETAANMSKIQSGKLEMRMLTAVEGDPQSNVGFELRGPFSVRGGSLVANITFTKVAGPERASATFISTGDRAFINANDDVSELPPVELGADLGTVGGGLGQLPIGHWFEDPQLSDGGPVGGADTHRIEADLNVSAALGDIVTLARQLGAEGVVGLPPLRAADLEHLQRAVRSATVDVHTGKDDLLLRRLAMEIRFGASAPSELQAALGELSGVRFTLDISVDEPNLPIEAPEAPTP